MRPCTPCVLGAIAAIAACSGNPSSSASGSTADSDAAAAPAGTLPAGSGDAGEGPLDSDSGAPIAATDDGATPANDSGLQPDGAPIPPARGATLPYLEYEAENGTTNGTLLGPSRAVNASDVFQSIAGESSGREAVELSATGQYVGFTTTSVANSVVVRFVIPDSADGSGQQATLGLYVNGTRVQSLSLTSQFAWAYGDPETTDATTNDPSDGYARHFYDEARVLLPADIPAGSSVSLQQDATDTAPYYVIDLIDLEEVPPALAQPAGTVSVASYGATGDGTTDDGQAIQNAIDDAQANGTNVWIPPGTYLDASTVLNVKSVAVYGAGMWRSTIEQSSARNTGDDGFASWSYAGAGDPPNTNNVFQFDTVQIPWRANCFAIYGGTGNAVEDSACADVVTYPGIFVDQEFDSNPFGGTTTIARDTIVRSGGSMYGTEWGALTVSGHDTGSPITGVSISDVDVEGATYAGLFFIGPNDAIDGVALANVAIDGAGTYGLAVDPTATGSATATGVVVTSPGSGGLQNGAPSAWTFTRGAGDTGW